MTIYKRIFPAKNRQNFSRFIIYSLIVHLLIFIFVVLKKEPLIIVSKPIIVEYSNTTFTGTITNKNKNQKVFTDNRDTKNKKTQNSSDDSDGKSLGNLLSKLNSKLGGSSGKVENKSRFTDGNQKYSRKNIGDRNYGRGRGKESGPGVTKNKGGDSGKGKGSHKRIGFKKGKNNNKINNKIKRGKGGEQWLAGAKRWKIGGKPPVYRISWQKQGIKGIVKIKIKVDTMGDVVSAEFVKKSGFSQLDNSALRAIKTYKYNSLKGTSYSIGIIKIIF